MRDNNWPTRIMRLILGGWFIFAGVIFLAARLGFAVQLPSDGPVEARAFMQALRDSQFISELMYVFFFAGGLATVFHRTAPLGLILLGPFVVVVFFFQLVLGGNWLWGSFWMGIFLALLWNYRERFSALWTLSSD